MASNGDLTYTVAPDATGMANVSVTLMDNGGTAFGGIDTSVTQTFTITVTPINDPPQLIAGTVADLTVLENAGMRSTSRWPRRGTVTTLENYSPGDADDVGQTP